MKQMNFFSIFLTLALLLLAPNIAAAEIVAEAAEIPYQVSNSDRIIIGTVSEIDTYENYTIFTITVNEWLYNPLPKETLKVRTESGTNFWTEDEVELAQKESALLMLKDENINEQLFRVPLGLKYPVSDRDTVIKELKAQGKWKVEDEAETNTGETKELTFDPETLDKLKKDPNFIAAYGRIPVFSTSEERKQWLDTLDQIYSESNSEMSQYMYPNGPVTNYGYTINGVLEVGVNKTVEKPFMDGIYKIFDSKAGSIGIKEVPLVFMREDLVVPVDETTPVKETASSSPSEEENNGELNNSSSSSSDDSGSSGKGNSSAVRYAPGFELLGSLACLYIGWKLRRKE